MKGVICCGKITISRTGIIGTRFISCFSRLNIRAPEKFSAATPTRPLKWKGSASLFQQTPINLASAHHVRTNHKVAHFALHGQVVHQFQHEVFENHAQAARANLALKSQLGNGLESIVSEAEADIFEFEEALVLLQESVLGLGENTYESILVEIVHYAGHRQAADKFGNQAIADEIAGLHLLEQFGVALLRRRGCGVRVEAEGTATGALLDYFFEADKSAAANKQNVGGVDGRKFLVRMFTAALRRHIGYS